jgi:hypothetical protein
MQHSNGFCGRSAAAECVAPSSDVVSIGFLGELFWQLADYDTWHIAGITLLRVRVSLLFDNNFYD